MRRRGRSVRGRPRAVSLVMAALWLATALASGCLFPPVEVDENGPGEPGGRSPDDVRGPDGAVARTGHQAQDGTIKPGFRMVNETVHGDPPLHLEFALPPHVTSFLVTLDWWDEDPTSTNQTTQLVDLDLGVMIERGTERIWESEHSGGGPGNPDAPVVIASGTDEPNLTVPDAVTLSATITPESGAGDVRWVCSVQYVHLVSPA